MLLAWYKLAVSRFVTQRPFVVIGLWVAVAVLLKIVSPDWRDVAADGDLAFLPRNVPSAVGQASLEEAFPGSNTRSRMIIVFANPESDLETGDLAFALDVTRRLHWMAARTAWQSLQEASGVSVQPIARNVSFVQQTQLLEKSVLAEVVRDNLTEAIEIEEQLSRFIGSQPDAREFHRLPDAYQIRGKVLALLGEESEQAKLDLDTHALMREQGTPLLDSSPPDWAKDLRDVWSWRNAIVGHKLGGTEARARLISLQLGTDFTAIRNIEIISGIEALVDELLDEHADTRSSDLQVEVSGSAAVGADMLRAAAGGVRKTELVTVLLVLLILAVVYRAPLLVAIPITSIALSLVVATCVIALLARDPSSADGWGLGVFTTTRIFIVVILFGSGTDFCMFFLARNRELLHTHVVETRAQMQRVVASGWCSVHDALVASAVTTIVGLGLMWFSEFEKFRFSGPVIAISLVITLLVCLTFTPALLSGFGRLAFWPQLHNGRGEKSNGNSRGRWSDYWHRFAEVIVSAPRRAIVWALCIVLIPAGYGLSCIGNVTYDLTEELSESAPSRRGANLISQFFPIHDGSPITVLLTRDVEFESEDQLREACNQLSSNLYVEGVESVRSLTDPLGDYPPGKRMGLFDKDAWRRRILRGHRITKERYISSVESMDRRVARFDIVIHENPFSLAASSTLETIRKRLQREVNAPESPWQGAQIAMSGTTVGITDLRMITQSDQLRIQLFVTLGVWLVLMIMLRQIVLSSFLIFTVLLSYFATIGVTYFVFSSVYGVSYSGLDWKVPIFLFVILVAVGQDYNVYLVTRIFQERKNLSLTEGVRRALHLTGGIITSCGLVMSGTFVAMTSPAVLHWLAGVLPAGIIDDHVPVLRGITELGFALSFGVLLDTLVVRSILVPSFVLLWNDWLQRRIPVSGRA